MAVRRRFGWVRKLPSGRWQGSYLAPDGRRRQAPSTFRTKSEADRWLALVESEMSRGAWTDPDRQRVVLGEFGRRWVEERANLRPRTVDLYRWLFGKYIAPHLGRLRLVDLDTGVVRSWRHDLLQAGVSPTMVAKAYRLLRAMLMTAVDDGILGRNPCRIRGAGTEQTQERPVLSVVQVFELAARMPPRYRALVLVTTFASLRWGEVTALRRADVDLTSGVVRVRSTFAERSTGELVPGPPKSRAGLRAVTLPGPVLSELQGHIDEHVGDSPDSLVFTGDKGGPVRRSNFNRRVGWSEALGAVGAPGLHFHDLRHTGNTLAAASGTSLRDLMLRMGHDSMRAALIYQHATTNADQHIADALSRGILAANGAPEDSSPVREPNVEPHADSTAAS